jgi:UDP-N-acetylglucosamine--N-acetylmuramyl-(pentapeptide) pyrophosphoryl-undecaprenol N-acetylglucosamine transferase
MMRPIGYYVHHQGAGHLHRGRLIATTLLRPCTLLGTFAPDTVGDRLLTLPDDRMDAGFDGADGTASRPNAFHYAPLGHAGIRARMAAIAAWVAANDPVLMIVDVSVEVTLFARLLSVPVVLVRLAGRRDDPPHLEAFRAAEALIAPFPLAFESPTTPPWVKEKTIYAGFLAPPAAVAHSFPVRGEIAVVLGRGIAPIEITCFFEAACATPDWTWRVYGDSFARSCVLPENLHVYGWVDDIGPALDCAEIVIGGAGDGLVSAVVARGKRFICLPEPRAFDEQIAKAERLGLLHLAIVLSNWPDGSHWPQIFLRAMALDPERLRALYDPDALVKTVAAIEAIAIGIRRRDPPELSPS